MPIVHRHQRRYTPPNARLVNTKQHVVLTLDGKPALRFPSKKDAEKWVEEHKYQLAGIALTILSAEAALAGVTTNSIPLVYAGGAGILTGAALQQIHYESGGK